MKTKQLATCALGALGLSLLTDNLPAQPVVSYTISGTSGHFTLDFTVNNTTPGTSGWDIYFFGVLVDGSVSGSPPGYYSTHYTTMHTTEITGPAFDWPFNNTWIDPSYSLLPTGVNRSGFMVSDTDLTAPTSVQYFAFGYNDGLPYTGPGNENLSSPYNTPLFVGYATVEVPEPASLSMSLAAGVLLAAFRRSGIRK